MPAARRTRTQAREVLRIAATEAKNEFGQVLEKAIRGDVVVITKHDAPKAVLLSIDEYDALRGAVHRELDNLTAEFDALFEEMQTPRTRAAMRAAFDASPTELGKAAVAAARNRG